MLQTRIYSKKDLLQVLGIVGQVTESWGAGWKELIIEMFTTGKRCPFKIERFVAVERGEIVGLLVLKKEILATVIYFLAAKPGRRGEGIGSELLKKAEEFAKGSGSSFLRVDVYDGFERNKKFYIKNGFKASGHVRNYYEFGDSQAFFYKRIR
ncbi:MAG: GNAT family N-acetyltransferase [Candidatus Micrarchaeota archaeon]